MSQLSDLVFDIDKAKGKLQEFVDKITKCSANNHKPHEQIVINPYRPRKPTVGVMCSNCSFVYERSATGAEIESYTNMMRSEITI